MGLDVYLYKSKAKIEQDSKKHPEHLFKIGYFRSSYNEGGIHHKLEQAGTHSLGEIFGAGEKYSFAPNWKTARVKAVQALDALKAFEKKVGGCAVTCISHNIFNGISEVSEGQAMARYAEELPRLEGETASGFECYSNRNGHFYRKPLKVRAAIPGKDCLGSPAVYIVYETEDGLGWYLAAMEVVIETIDFVLADKELKKFRIHWSS